MTRLANIQACAFDAYGTLFDVHSAIGQHRARLGDAADRVSQMWRTKQLEYTWLRSLMGAHVDFWQVTQDALDYALETFDVCDAELRDDLMEAYLRLECYPEVRDTLAALHRAGMRAVILTNGSRPMIEAAVASAGLDDLLDGILTIDEVGIYKPDPRVYRLACERFGLEASQIAFQSSNAWDAAGAAYFGLRVVWINRFGQKRERLPKAPDAELEDLRGLPALVAG